MALALQLDCKTGDGVEDPPTLNQMVYTNVVDFLRYCETNGLCTVVASNWGSAGTGEDYYDGANPSGENAFTYVEFDAGTLRWGLLVQYADGTAFGTSPGNPGLIDDATLDGVAFAMAFRADGTSPWGGTTGDTGSNTKGATVWTAGGSTVYVFPRSNGVGGDHATNKENMVKVGDCSGANSVSRMHFAANADAFVMLLSDTDDGNYDGLYMGRYVVRTGLAAVTLPYIMVRGLSSSGKFSLGTGVVYGGLVGSGNPQGGMLALPADTEQDFTLDTQGWLFGTEYQPNLLITPNEYDVAPYLIFAHESGKGFGYAGQLDSALIAVINNTSNHQTNSAGTLAYIGSSTTAAYKFAIPWDAGALPGVGATRAGRQDFTA